MSSDSKKVLVIGAGFAGLSAASFLAQKGWQVTVIEKMMEQDGHGSIIQVMVMAKDCIENIQVTSQHLMLILKLTRYLHLDE